jgi:KDO2-lipid IV(A) lauroyltransferase
MNLQKITNSRVGVRLGLVLGQSLPPKLGYLLSQWIAEFFSRSKSNSMANSVRLNQTVVGKCLPEKENLDRIVKGVFTHAGRCFVDLYRTLGDKNKVLEIVSDSKASQKFVNLSKDASFGAFIAVPHISNFDLCLQALAYRGVDGHVLTHSQPTGGYEIQNKIRAQTGLEITPVNQSSLKLAIKRMKKGGFVFTGVDRPILNTNIELSFFGHPAPLPTGHIRMAEKANVPIIVASASMGQDGIYNIHFSDPIPIQSNYDPDTVIRRNGETILKIIEARILEHPDQWLMYYPVWSNITNSYD